jgi:hypothetical protein
MLAAKSASGFKLSGTDAVVWIEVGTTKDFSPLIC